MKLMETHYIPAIDALNVIQINNEMAEQHLNMQESKRIL